MKESTEPRTWNAWEYQSWGHHISFLRWEDRRVYGHLHNRREFKPGDEVRFRMESGKVARFKVKDVEYSMDPKDMFFATVEDVGYAK
jgi:hypothetical protein